MHSFDNKYNLNIILIAAIGLLARGRQDQLNPSKTNSRIV